MVSRKTVSYGQISRKDIIGIGKTLKNRGVITSSKERTRVEEILNKAHSGVITREKIYGDLQKEVAAGNLSEEHASHVARELGLEEKRFRYFKDISESRSSQPRAKPETEEKHPAVNKKELKEKLDSPVTSDRKISHMPDGAPDNSHSAAADSPTKTKPTSIWGILNSKRN